MGVEISPLDPGSAAFDEWYGVYRAAYCRPFDFPCSSLEKRVGLANDAYGRCVALALRESGRIVAGATAHLPLQDNTSVVYLDVFVHPDHRRCGFGRLLVEHMAKVAEEARRERLFIDAMWSVDEETSPAREFVQALGFSVDLVHAVRQLDLPASPAGVPPADGYTLHSWRDRCPDEWLDQYADLYRRYVSEAPNGVVGRDEEFWDRERVLADERDCERANRAALVVVAQDESGLLAGHTQLRVAGGGSEVQQWDTLVLPEHRGRGLGLAMKIAAMRESADLLADRHRIVTYNAVSNTPMIAINETLGYRQVAWIAEFLRDVQS